MSQPFLYSQVTNATYQDNIGIQVIWNSVDAVGEISVEASINYNPDTTAGDWSEITFDQPLVQPASNDGSYLININQFPFIWYRVKYISTSGSGVLNVYFCSKEV